MESNRVTGLGNLHVDSFGGDSTLCTTSGHGTSRPTARKVGHPITRRHLAIFGDVCDGHNSHLADRGLREEVAGSSMSFYSWPRRDT